MSTAVGHRGKLKEHLRHLYMETSIRARGSSSLVVYDPCLPKLVPCADWTSPTARREYSRPRRGPARRGDIRRARNVLFLQIKGMPWCVKWLD